MCLAVPLEIVELRDNNKALVRRGEGSLQVDVSLLRSAAVGDYVLVHAGFAIEKLDSSDAEATLAILDELGDE
jgi:hydrogenase expression/formation protein HypC